jgi:hypothetical protein
MKGEFVMSTVPHHPGKLQAFGDSIPIIDADFSQELVRAVRAVATSLKYMGTGDAGSTMGALEFVAVEVSGAIRSGMGEIAAAIMQAAETLAEARIEAAHTQRESSKGGREESAQLPDVDALLAHKEDELHARN